MTEFLTSIVTSVLRPAARPLLVVFGVLAAALVGLTAFGAISVSTAAGVVCGALFGAAVIGGAILLNRKRFAPHARHSAAIHRSDAEDAAVLDRLEPLDREVR